MSGQLRAAEQVRLQTLGADALGRRAGSAGASPRAFRWLALATLVSNVGNGLRDAALPLAAAGLTRDPSAVAGVLVAARLPWLVLAPVSGTLADTGDRRRLMVVADLVRAGAMAALAVALARGDGRLVALYAVAFVIGAGETAFDNAAHAVLPSVVHSDRLAWANGRLEALVLTGRDFAGPALGGVLFAVAAALPVGLDAASFAVSAVLVMLLPSLPAPPRTGRLRDDVLAGVRWLRGSPALLRLSWVTAAANLALNAGLAVFVLFALDVLGVQESRYGLLLAAYAGGGVIGGLAAARAARRFGVVTAVTSAVAAAAVALLAMGGIRGVAAAAALQALIGCAGGVFNVVTVSLRQSLVPHGLLGRVNAAHRVVCWGAMPLGAALGGVLGRAVGIRAVYVVAGGFLLAVAAVTPPLLRGLRGRSDGVS